MNCCLYSRAGSTSKAVFTPEALSPICRYGEGVFRKINIICDNALLIGYGLQQKTVDEAMVKEVLEDLETPVPQQEVERPKIVYNPQPLFQEKGEESPFPGEDESRPRFRFLTPTFAYLIAAAIGLVLIVFLTLDIIIPPRPQAPGPAQNPPGAGEKVAAVATETKSEPARNEPSKPANEPKAAALPDSASAQETSPPVRGGEKPAVAEPPKTEQAPAPPKAEGKPERRFQKTLGAAKGETLYSLARQYYKEANPSLIDCILEFNPKITDIHSLSPHLKIQVPEISEDSFLLMSPDGSYKIILGTFNQSKQSRTYKNVPELKDKTIEVVSRKVSPEESWYRVTAGQFDTREEGLKTIRALKKKGLMPGLKGK